MSTLFEWSWEKVVLIKLVLEYSPEDSSAAGGGILPEAAWEMTEGAKHVGLP